jgi:TPR repeat protein
MFFILALFFFSSALYVSAQKMADEFRADATKNNPAAQHNLAVCYYNGYGVNVDKSEAVKWYKKAADQNFAPAQANLGACYYYGIAIQQDFKKAAKLFLYAAEQGNDIGQYNLGRCYEYGQGVAQNYSEAARWYRLAAEQNHADAQAKLGYCYERGAGIGLSKSDAFRWYDRAAAQYNPDGIYRLANCYLNGFGTSINKAAAMELYHSAAQRGQADAQLFLGKCYSEGRNVARNKALSVRYYRMAADASNCEAQYLLGLCYYYEDGIEESKSQAVWYFNKAAEQGHAKAQCLLAACLYHGKGISQDKNLARKWFEKALSKRTDLTEEQISFAEARISARDIAPSVFSPKREQLQATITSQKEPETTTKSWPTPRHFYTFEEYQPSTNPTEPSSTRAEQFIAPADTAIDYNPAMMDSFISDPLDDAEDNHFGEYTGEDSTSTYTVEESNAPVAISETNYYGADLTPFPPAAREWIVNVAFPKSKMEEKFMKEPFLKVYWSKDDNSILAEASYIVAPGYDGAGKRKTWGDKAHYSGGDLSRYGKHAKYHTLRYKWNYYQKVEEMLRTDSAFIEIINLAKQICRETEYDWGNYSAYKGAPVKATPNLKHAVCAGYASEVMNKALELKCVKSVQEWTSPGHAWNVLKLVDGRTLYIDITWFDNEHINEKTGEIVQTDDYDWANITFDKELFNYSGISYGAQEFCHTKGKFSSEKTK